MMFTVVQLLCWASLALSACDVSPAAVYDGDGAAKDAPIALKIGNGGAGQSGLVGGRALDPLLSFS